MKSTIAQHLSIGSSVNGVIMQRLSGSLNSHMVSSERMCLELQREQPLQPPSPCTTDVMLSCAMHVLEATLHPVYATVTCDFCVLALGAVP